MADGVPFGKYHLMKRLGRGGMAEVFLAAHAGRQVALKRILPLLGQQREYQRRFLDEARAGATLSHPHLVTIEEVGLEDGSLYLTMEYVHGVNLAELLAACTARGEPFPWPVAVRIAAYVAEGLQYAHGVGLLHRDVSPQNVMVAFNGAVKLLDLGVARVADGASLTQPGVVMVKPEYAAPERIAGARADARTDVYGLGVTLYELLAGHLPLRCASTGETVEAVTDVGLPPLKVHRRDVPTALTRALQAATARDPDDRPPNIAGLRQLLEKALREQSGAIGVPEVATVVAHLFPGAQARPKKAPPPKKTARADGSVSTLSDDADTAITSRSTGKR